MKKEGDTIVEAPTEAREAVNVKGMTTVLWASIALAIVAMAVAWWFLAH